MVLRLMPRSPRRRIRLVTVIGGLKVFVRPGWACKNLRRLDTSNGCQDHAVLPYASAPFVRRAGDRSRAAPRPAFTPARPMLSRPPQSLPQVADDHDTPLLGAGTVGVIVLICPTG